jgi:2-keto-4-pentenoate hydratase
MTPVYHIQAINLHCHSAVQQNAAGRTLLSTDHSAPSDGRTEAPELAAIADSFVSARRQGRALPGFPGDIPDDLVTAYRVQDLAIAQWPDRVAGWKVGFIAPERRDGSGDERLLGPIFARQLKLTTGGQESFDVFAGGFGAVEAEYVLRLDADAPADKTHWTPEEAATVASTLFIGMEVASSPLATINQLGPRVVVSDFGNNNGLVMGAEIPGWADRSDASLTCTTWIEGQQVGQGGATTLPGGLRAAFAFALARSARRGRPLKAGDLIATGNATGIHDILPGQRARIDFAGHGTIECLAVAATPKDEGDWRA